MKVLPRITLITPSYQQGHFLRTTIESVLREKYPNLEYLVADGGSQDETKKILRSFGSRIRWWSRKDRGQIDALNQAFATTSGEIVGFLNADDVLLPGTLWQVAALFQQHHEVGWITGEYQVIDAMGKPTQPWMPAYKRLQRQLCLWMPFLFPWILSVNNPLSQPSTFWRRRIGEKAGKLNESLSLAFDYEWWWRLYFEAGPPLIVPFCWSAFRVHADSKGGLQFLPRLSEQWQIAKAMRVSPMMLSFHHFHNQVVSRLYEQLTRDATVKK